MERYQVIMLFNEPVLFTPKRINRKDMTKEGLYIYDIRHDDECLGIPCEVKPFVMVNHWGTIISKKSIHKTFIEDGEWIDNGEYLTIEEYKNNL